MTPRASAASSVPAMKRSSAVRSGCAWRSLGLFTDGLLDEPGRDQSAGQRSQATLEDLVRAGRAVSQLRGSLLRIVTYPGLLLQKITTKEPDEKQLATAIKALEEALTV